MKPPTCSGFYGYFHSINMAVNVSVSMTPCNRMRGHRLHLNSKNIVPNAKPIPQVTTAPRQP